jgi:hypothetical protein
MPSLTRQEIIDLIIRKANEHDLVPAEFLGGAIAESSLNPEAWRQTAWPDWSAGLFQQTVAFAPDGDHSASDENVALIKRLYFDPVHACDVAAKQYRYWRYDPEVSAEQAWCAYNWPGSYHHYLDNPNLGNYRHGLQQAAMMVAGTRAPSASLARPAKIVFDPDFPRSEQDDDWSCCPTSLDWAMRSLGRKPGISWIEQRMVIDGVVSHAQGLLDHTGAGVVAWLGINDATHYGSDGYGISNHQCPITWDQLVPEITPHAPYPILLGLPNWVSGGHGHWVGVRGFSNNRIQLANPANSAAYGQGSLSRAEFEQRAANNASIVRVLHPDLLP